MKQVSFNKYKFYCNRCGDCCYDVLVKRQIPVPLYDHTGRFKFNPNTSAIVNYHEKPDIEKFIKNKTNFNVNIKPMEVFFFKDFQIGFIYEYQMGVEDKQNCYYYDKKNRRCNIYLHRPAVCKYFPLQIANQNFHIPKPSTDCPLIRIYIDNQYKVKNKEKIQFKIDYDHLKIAFPKEYKLFLKTRAEWYIQNLYFSKFFGDLLIPLSELSPKRIKGYEIRDMTYFLEWAKSNFKEPEKISLLEEYKENYEIIAKKILKDKVY